MKANELMIGDWFMKDNNCTETVDGCILYYFDTDPYFNEGTIFGLPITKEILEMNGWYFDDLVNEWYSNNRAPKLYGRDCSSLSMFDGSVTVKYVHELQHALRLCGLNDLADNFKVEEEYDDDV